MAEENQTPILNEVQKSIYAGLREDLEDCIKRRSAHLVRLNTITYPPNRKKILKNIEYYDLAIPEYRKLIAAYETILKLP